MSGAASEVSVVVERLGHRGDGIAPGPVYAPRTLPGEVVTGVLSGDRIEKPRIETPSPDRVSPPCRHFRMCGGCALQHARDAFVADWKLDVVRQALAANGAPAPLRRLHTSPVGTRRRAALSGRRTKSGAIVGFHARQSDQVIGIANCRVLAPDILSALPALEEIVVEGGSRKGEVRLTVTVTDEGLDVAATGGRDADLRLTQRLVEVGGNGGFARLSWNDDTVFQRSDPHVTISGHRIPLPQGAFLQATVEGETALIASVLDALGTTGGPVLDLFSGLGTFSVPLAESHDVHAVEGSRDLLQALDWGWRHAQGLHRITTEARDLFRRPLLPDEMKRFGAIVIDPPRAGAAAQIAEIARSNVPVVAHVSCNPVTFARDALTLLSAGYEIARIDVVDQFRWSTHIELVAKFHLVR